MMVVEECVFVSPPGCPRHHLSTCTYQYDYPLTVPDVPLADALEYLAEHRAMRTGS